MKPHEPGELRAANTGEVEGETARGGPRKPGSTPTTLSPRPITALRGVGPALATRLQRLGVEQVEDLLFLLPRGYEDRTHVRPLGSSLARDVRSAAEKGQSLVGVVEGEVLLTQVVNSGRRQLLCKIGDVSGFLTLRFFHSIAYHEATLARGTRLRFFGKISRGPLGLEMIHPEYRCVPEQDTASSSPDSPPASSPADDSLTPLYPLTEGVSQTKLRGLVGHALDELASTAVPDWLPGEVTGPLGLPSLKDALLIVHRPPRETRVEMLVSGLHPGQRRLAFEELLAHHLALKLMRQAAQTETGWPLEDREGLQARFLTRLPFRLTAAQARALAEVDADLSARVPMSRLLQGDVGCGKTVVAAVAAARAAGSGLQAALMAPTELLAEQHWRSFRSWFEPLGVPVARLSGSDPARRRRSSIEALASGEVRIAVGTHALFQEDVQFACLALVIVDEQHRFGVQQRLRLAEKGQQQGHFPHQLIMTATPIPRTLAMTAYADLDISVIDELPPGRRPVTTVVMPEKRREKVVARVLDACRQGRRAYWVCPLIGESEELHSQAAVKTHAALAEALPQLTVGLVHGRMPSSAKDSVMRAFKAGQIQLLVATSVIEVGVDVPEATLMIIENAEGLGLAQLHQLRGRVGRGSEESTCLLMYHGPLADLARERLKVIRKATDGFEIARRDLELRGPGELLGTRQTGLAQLKVADLVRDADLLSRVQTAAELLLASYPDNIAPLAARWIGSGECYARVG
jgi:ATP-dependent DNA helicase RecG